MPADLRLLARLRLRQFARSANYWLRVLGYDPESDTLSERLYGVYLALFGGGWAVAMAVIALNAAVTLGQALPAPAFDAVPALLPWLVLVAQACIASQALRSSPLKLTFPDITYLAGAPISRGALALVACVQAGLRTLVVALPAAALVAVALAAGLAPAALEPSAAAAVAVALPLVALTLAVAWCLGLARAALPRQAGRRWLWLAPIALLPLARLLPGLLLWPGRALALALAGRAQALWAPLLWLALLPLMALVALLGGRVHMADVARESQTYARIQALGMGGLLAPEVVRSIRRRAALAGRRPVLRLPRAGGSWALAARAGLALVRDPSGLLSLVTWAGLLTVAGNWIAAGDTLPPQWAAWLFWAMFAPPAALADALRADTEEPFLRQLLPQSNLRLLVAGMALPALALTLVALGLWLLARPASGAALPGALAIIALAGLLALCQGASLLPVLTPGRRLPYAPAAAISLGAVILASAVTHAPFAALGVAALAGAVLVVLISQSRRFAA
jgi:hypothetical protein